MMEDIFPRGTEVWYLDTDELEVKHGKITTHNNRRSNTYVQIQP